MTLDFPTTSLLVVDAQRGFTDLCPDELPVPGGAAIVPAVNELLALPFARVDATQDWHPPDHGSFLGRRDNLYPPHCVQGTPGAGFLPGLHTHRFSAVWRKGYDRDFEAYAVTAQHPGFAAFLRASGIRTVVVCGIATNICCYFAARDLRTAGFEVVMVDDASAGIDVPAAGLFQDRAKADATAIGIRYVSVAAKLSPAGLPAVPGHAPKSSRGRTPTSAVCPAGTTSRPTHRRRPSPPVALR